MTRETKIGLLVGLAFIIVIGILLSDHLSSTNEPGAAPLKVAGDMVRSGLGQPGNDDVAPMLRAPSVVTPTSPVVTNAELNHRDALPPVVFVPPAAPPHGNAITPTAPTNPASTIAERLRQAAAAQGEDVVPVNNQNQLTNNVPAIKPPTNITVPPAKNAVKTAARSYEAQSGDSLGLIARRAYGSGCKANRDAIVAANPALAEDRDMIVAGRTYIIPALGNANASTAEPTKPIVEAPASVKVITYVVQPNDTLWSIAMDQVGNANAVAAIEDLNRTVLNGSDRVRPNMKLKLPGKQN